MRSVFSIFFLASMFVGLPAEAAGQKSRELALQCEVVRLANEIFKSPPAWGFSTNAAGEISGSANLGRILKWFSAAKISAKLGAKTSYWYGPRQADVAKGYVDRNRCAIDATRMLFENLKLNSVRTGKMVPPPKNYNAVVRKYSTKIIYDDHRQQNVSGSGNININGPATIVAPPLGDDPFREASYMQQGASCAFIGRYPDAATPLASSSNQDLKLEGQKAAADLRLFWRGIVDERAALVKSQGVRANFSEINMKYSEKYHREMEPRIYAVLTETLLRLGRPYPRSPSEGPTLEGFKVYCGDMHGRNGGSELADYLLGIGSLLPS